MQTFLPYPDFNEVARTLDWKRLGKQRVEGKQIMMALGYLRNNDLYKIDKNGKRRKRGWLYHSATQMWVGYEYTLARYINTMILEWIARGYKNTMPFYDLDSYDKKVPSWLEDKNIHISHQSNLVRKDKKYYSKFFPDVPNNLEYIWPLTKNYDNTLRIRVR